MHKIRRTVQAVFVITLAALLVGGVLFVTGQAAGLVSGQGSWLKFFDDYFKPGMCAAASLCAIAGFLLSYGSRQDSNLKEEAGTR